MRSPAVGRRTPGCLERGEGRERGREEGGGNKTAKAGEADSFLWQPVNIICTRKGSLGSLAGVEKNT